MSTKEQVIELLRCLPEDATLEEISEEVAILAAIRRGEADVAAGRVVSHEEVERRSAAWIPEVSKPELPD